MAVGEDLAAILAARPGAAPLDPPIRNALRVTVRGRALLNLRGADAFNRRRSDGFATPARREVASVIAGPDPRRGSFVAEQHTRRRFFCEIWRTPPTRTRTP